MRSDLISLVLLFSLSAALPAEEIRRIEVYPARINLDSQRATAQILVTAQMADGGIRDLTREANFSPIDPKLVAIRNAVVSPLADGKTEILIRAGGMESRLPVEIRNQQKEDPVRFISEVEAILTKHGCNGGSCHGSPQGKGGFSLSLYGYDPLIDAESLVRGGLNRRTDTFNPAQSLLLKKPLMRIPHVGGKKLNKSDIGYQVLHDWIRQGCQTTDDKQPACVQLKVIPGPDRVLRSPHLDQQLSIQAIFADGTVRDVTRLASYDVSHKEIVQVNENGLVTGLKRGQAAVSVRYLNFLESVHFTITEDVKGFQWNNPPENNIVDQLVNAKLKQLQILPSPTCDDATFLRRVSLDLTGLLPPAEKARKFLSDSSPDKRSILIDELLNSEEYARYNALRLADLLKVNPSTMPEGRAELFADYLIAGYRNNQPFDQMAREILTATGDASKVPGCNYYLAATTTADLTEATAQIFMGSRINCAKCHNHPFENWTQEDYFRISAVFARIKKDGKVVSLKDTGEVSHNGKDLAPYGLPVTDPKADRRIAFATWLTRPGNPYFAKVEVNRIWSHLFGQGIVNPVDDFRSSNPARIPDLIDQLAREFEKSGYDRKKMIRLICNSQTYQRSTSTNPLNEADLELFSHYPIRRLTAEQTQDAIGYATRGLAPASGVPEEIRKLEVEIAKTTADKGKQEALKNLRNRTAYATQRLTPEQSQFLKAFGQSKRETPCACERIDEPTVDQALQLLNGPLVGGMLDRGSGIYAAISDNNQLIDQLWLSSLCRFPSPVEREKAIQHLQKNPNRQEAVRDLAWAVINTREFLLQH